ncbi:MAG: flagellar motor switch protein FliN [Eubacterium sp.]|nr:flagellar motor switch protein FliN [Eubacterium sp.]
MGTTVFNSMELDAIGEIMNISIGASATAVSTMLGTATKITAPTVSVESRSQFEFRDFEPAVGVEISYVDGLHGRNIMMFSRDDVRIIVGMMMGMEIPADQFVLDEMNESAIREVMNQMMGSSATALSEFLGYPVNISTPVSFEIQNEKAFKEKYFPNNEEQVVVRFKLEIGDKLSSEFLNIMSVSLAKKLLEPYASSLGSSADADDEMVDAEEAGAEDAGAKQAAAEKTDVESTDTQGTGTDTAAAGETEPAQAGGSDSGKPLDQNATDALLARLRGETQEQESQSQEAAEENTAPAPSPAQEAEISDEEAKRQFQDIQKHSSGNRSLSQEEMDALMAKLRTEDAGTAPETTAAPSASAPSTPAPAASVPSAEAPIPSASAAAPHPASAATPSAAEAQPQQGQPYVEQSSGQPAPVYAAPDPMMASILSAMQQSQTAMMELIREIHEENKEAAQAREAELEALREASSRDAAADKQEKNTAHNKNRILRSMKEPEYVDLPDDGDENPENKEMLMRVPLEISVEVGRTRKPVKDILDLTQGSLVVLDKMAGEQADLYVNGECIAHGDIVVVEDNFGIRITEILNHEITKENQG